MADAIDITKVIRGSTSDMTIDSLAKKGVKQVKVLDQATITRLISQVIDKVLAERAETSVGMRGRLKIDVLSVLTEERRKTLIDKFPRLIYKPWARAMRSAAPR